MTDTSDALHQRHYEGPWRSRHCPDCGETISFPEWSRCNPYGWIDGSFDIYRPAMNCPGCNTFVIWEDAKP